MEIVDAYTHCGLTKYEPIEDVRRVLDAAGVHRAVLVQHLGEFDNSYIESIVAAEPERFAGVCMVDHERDDAVEVLNRVKKSGHCRGVRLTSDAYTDAQHVFDAAADLGMIIVLYCVDGIANSLEPLARFLAAHPAARVVLSHLGNPRPSEGPRFKASEAAFRLAQHPGIYYQVSGMKMFCPYPHELAHELISGAVEHFGTSRLVWGSNYPVVGREKDYVDDLGLLLEGKLPVPEPDIAAIAGGNARRLWFGGV